MFMRTMEWTKEKVLEELNSNSQFSNLANEWEGSFQIRYPIQGNTVVLSNSVGGKPEAFLAPPLNQETICDARKFAKLANEILQEQVNKV